jgi:hypothetical protein
MEGNNTLFILAKWGLKRIDKAGIFESHMWLLDGYELSMRYVSLHKSKAERASKGGEIIQIRDATQIEIEEHQQLLRNNGLEEMQVLEGRKIIVFQLDQNWKTLWPKEAKRNPMAYKGLGFVE